MTAPATRPVFDLTPAGRAVVILASLALGAAWTTGSEPARLAACLLIAPLLTCWASKLRRFDGLTISVGKRRTRAGTALLERLRLQHRGRRGVWDVHLSEHGLLASVRGQPAHVELVPGGGTREVELPLRARARGGAPARTFTLTTQHPLGLVRLTARLTADAALIVEPARVALALPLTDYGSQGDDTHEAARGRNDDAFYALREVRDGEDFARVHALRSATLGTPVRVLRRGAARHSVRILLDLRSPPGRLPQRYQGQAFEWAVSAATTLVEGLTQRGRTCDVVVLGKHGVSFDDIGERAPAATLFEYLANVRAQPYAPTPESTLAWLAAGDGDVFWIAAGGFVATGERERAGSRVRWLEWVA